MLKFVLQNFLYQYGLASAGASLLTIVHGNAKRSLIADVNLFHSVLTPNKLQTNATLNPVRTFFYNLENNI